MTVNWNFELTNVALLIGAIVAAIYARRQVGAMRESNQKQADSTKNQELQLHASVLLSLNERWESPSMTSAVGELRSLIYEVENELAQSQPETSLIDLRRRSAPLYLSRLREMESKAPERYLSIFRVCTFFERWGTRPKQVISLWTMYSSCLVSRLRRLQWFSAHISRRWSGRRALTQCSMQTSAG